MAVLQHDAVLDIAAHKRAGTLTGDILSMDW
jgi:hypothetical protein